MSADTPCIRELDQPPEVLRRLAVRIPERYPVLLESVARGPLGRFSILAAHPRAALWQDRAGGLHAAGIPVPREPGFLTALERWWRTERTAPQPPELPFAGGWAVFLGYELAAEIEPRLALPAAAEPWRAFALRTPSALIHDRLARRVYAIAEPHAAGDLERIAADAALVAAQPAEPPPLQVRAVHEEPPEAFLERVRRAQEHIRAGDVYQANLSRAWHVELAAPADAGALYERLCAANPAPFAALAQWRGLQILSSSPERLVQIARGEIQTRPIAGTRPRRPGADAAAAHELIAHPKERAEHIMLIDLERNDLGRVCEPGSVRVDELMVVESYTHVHHIVSNVRGRLRADVTPIGALRAVFPGGTITGCPKVRCMQLIAVLEGCGRGAYTGSLGVLSRDGACDFNILIRTMTAANGRLGLRAGAGIVADSVPERELEETRAKARGLLAALAADAAPQPAVAGGA